MTRVSQFRLNMLWDVFGLHNESSLMQPYPHFLSHAVLQSKCDAKYWSVESPECREHNTHQVYANFAKFPIVYNIFANIIAQKQSNTWNQSTVSQGPLDGSVHVVVSSVLCQSQTRKQRICNYNMETFSTLSPSGDALPCHQLWFASHCQQREGCLMAHGAHETHLAMSFSTKML